MFHRNHGKRPSVRARIGVLGGSLAGLSVAGLMLAGAASASTTFDPSSGNGFVGKGDVQQVFGLNNNQVQTDANNIGFTYNSADTKVDETTWTCTNKAGNKQYKSDTTTTTSTSSGLTDTVARQGKTQVTGFNLTGFAGTPTTSSSTTTGGTPLDQCGNGETYISGSDVTTTTDTTDQYLAASDGSKSPAATALDGANVWHLANGLNPVTGSANYNTSNGSVY